VVGTLLDYQAGVSPTRETLRVNFTHSAKIDRCVGFLDGFWGIFVEGKFAGYYAEKGRAPAERAFLRRGAEGPEEPAGVSSQGHEL
jgi:hypothetical protein